MSYCLYLIQLRKFMTFLVSIIAFTPLAIMFIAVILSLKKHLNTFLNYSFIALCTTISIMCYCGLLISISSFFNQETELLIVGVSGVMIIFSYFLLFPSLTLTLFFFGKRLFPHFKRRFLQS